MAQNEARGYPQMIERIDCMLWKNFPFAWQVLNKGHHGEWCVVVLEGVEYYDMWIWHAFFWHEVISMTWTCCTELDNVCILVEGHALDCNYEININQSTKGYFVADGIYVIWSTFVKTIFEPLGHKKSHFRSFWESCRNDVERAFGVFQHRFSIAVYPAPTWPQYQMWEVINNCVIMHNMIIQSKRGNPLYEDHLYDHQCPFVSGDH
jgi:hypothetical protein